MPNFVIGDRIYFSDDCLIVVVVVVETQNFASLRQQQPNNHPKNKFGPQSQNLASIVRGYKSGVKKYSTMNHIDFIWQPGFYDRIIRNEKEFSEIQQYILHNPTKWDNDRNNQDGLWI